MLNRTHLNVLGGAALLALSACAVPPANMAAGPNPYPMPPAVQIETIPPPPLSADAQIWQPGHWDWTGAAYAWTPGRWVARAGHGAQWQPGYWTVANGAWTWVPPHWV